MFDNKVEQVKHLPLKVGEVARYVIVPGDPNRVEIIASVFDDYQMQGSNREFNAARGTYKGTDVSVVSTGIGCPSTAIAVEELAYIGAEVFIRIGTSGAVENTVKKGDIFTLKNLTTKRPALGIPASNWNSILGKKAKKNFSIDEYIK